MSGPSERSAPAEHTPLAGAPTGDDAVGAGTGGPFTRILRRREDQLWIRFDFYNLALARPTADAPPVLQRVTAGPAVVVVNLPAQHLAEQAFRESGPSGGSTDTPAWPADVRVAAGSRLAFQVPADTDTLPFDEKTLLRWAEWEPLLAPTARPRDAPPPTSPLPLAAPTTQQTAIEVPWRLLLSPHAGAGWIHAAAPVTHGGRTELWHSRLGTRSADGAVHETGGDHSLRAVWATDPDFSAWLLPAGSPGAKTPVDGSTVPATGLPFRMSLTPKDRLQIVRASSDTGIAGYLPEPVEADQLMLTAHGAWLDVHGSWNPPPGVLSIASWQHRAALGRDQQVRVVSRGYLLPFGHPAALVTATERRLGPTPTGKEAAYLRQRVFLVIRRPTRSYAAFAQGLDGRRLPFRRLTLTATRTPDLDPTTPFVASVAGTNFLPGVAGSPYPFPFAGVDHSGRTVQFTAPAVFVDASVAFSEAAMGPLRAAYNALPAGGVVRRRPTGGQRIALAPSVQSGDTDVQADSILLAADAPAGGHSDAEFLARDQPRCHPALSGASIRLTAAEHLTGGTLGAIDITLDPRYLEHGFDATNAARVFATLVTPVGMGVGPDRGGPLTPGMEIVALSRSLGPVGGDLDTLAAGTIDTPAILASAPNEPQILGGIKLSDVVKPTSVEDGKLGVGAMALRSPDGFGQNPVAGPHDTETALFSFRPELRDSDPFGILQFYPNTFCEITLSNTYSRADPAAASLKFKAMLLNGKPWDLISDLPDPDFPAPLPEDPDPGKPVPLPDPLHPGPPLGNGPAFTLRLLGTVKTFVEIDFTRFLFVAETGKEVRVEPALGDIRFSGALRCVQKLVQSVPAPKGWPKGGVLVHKLEDRLEVGLKATLPPVRVGVFTLKNIMFGFGVVVPLDPRADTWPQPVRFLFHFAERDNPFLLSVYCFGGGGYLTMGAGTDGMEFFEIALEFGAHYEADFGVASGMIEAMAGIYFRLDLDPHGKQEIQLTAYVRLHGAVQALGIVSITVEMYLGLTYQSEGNKLIGQATVLVEVSVAFFTMSISMHAERRFSGDEHDPTFLDQMPTQDDWSDYAAAFAPIGA